METTRLKLAAETAKHKPRQWYLPAEERSGHVLVVGANSQAKRGLLLNAMVQDIAAGAGVAVIDTTGRYAKAVLDLVPPARLNDVTLFQPQRMKRIIGYNPFAGVPLEQQHRAAQDIMQVFKLVWSLDYTSHPLLLDLLPSAARVLLETDAGTMVKLYGLLTNTEERAHLVGQCEDSMARKFWRDFEAWDRRDKRDKPQSALTRLRAFLSDPILRGMLGQTGQSKLSFGALIERGNVFVADLARGELGTDTAQLMGVLFALELERLLGNRETGTPFYVYLPEVQFLHPEVAARVLGSATERAGWMVSIDQVAGLDPSTRTGLLGAERVLSFRLGPDDARQLAGRFRLPQAETTLTTLAADRVAISDTKYAWQALPVEHRTYRHAAHIRRRSEQGLGARPGVVHRKIDGYLDRL